jgi:2,4-dienoyl-CoA reductase-like NADH-dependent reductase (Old Yellow Enzyme family)/thioredoxin reductase
MTITEDAAAHGSTAASTEPHPVYPHLFSPFELGRARLKNRIVHASTSTRYAEKGQVTDALIAYHVNRARGGAAMTVTEPLGLLRRQSNGVRVDVWSPEVAPGLRRWAEAVRAEDCLLIAQVQDPGRGRHEEGRPGAPISASSLPDDLSWSIPHALSQREIADMVAEFAASARILRDAGWAGVEISAGHGHLFHQFLSPAANDRTDGYGRDLEGRTRLLRELIAAIRAACGPDFLIGVKLPAEDGVPGGVDLELSAAITARLHAAGGFDYLTYCWGAHAASLEIHLPDLHGPRTPYVEKIRALADHAPGVPVGALGLITDPNEGERIVRDGLGDLVMMARPLVTDPAWPVKSASGREAEIRYCVSCNTCWHLISTHGRLSCDNNPRVGMADEADWRPAKVARAKRVAVVGGGVAGLEAAWVAAARGHDVTLFSASDELGGKARVQTLLPGGENLSSVYDYQQLAARRAGVRFELGAAVSADDLAAFAPDEVVLATGATPSWPGFLPAEYRDAGLFPDAREAVAVLARIGSVQPGTAVLYDQDHTAFTYALAEFMADRFEAVRLITPRERICGNDALVVRQSAYRRLAAKKVQITTLATPVADAAIEEGALTIQDLYADRRERIEDVAFLTFATPRRPDQAFLDAVRARFPDAHLIGDCYAPRFLLNATAEGHRIGNQL